ncbi:unnamed protein product [Prorocentrum cordatum]|uniref:Uncharacterized protein n=1 Tax=Prorocentrum cordatum TaxID=2364126 RepID=A0ABN9V6D2_9DINO|nr:unnamed protein product [Polarella glacialis]
MVLLPGCAACACAGRQHQPPIELTTSSVLPGAPLFLVCSYPGAALARRSPTRRASSLSPRLARRFFILFQLSPPLARRFFFVPILAPPTGAQKPDSAGLLTLRRQGALRF